MRIHLLRHGECGDEAYLRGRCDSRLTQSGLENSLQTAKKLLKRVPNSLVCLSSSASRCQQIYSELQQKKHANMHFLPAGELSDLWVERDFGVLDGLSLLQAKAEFPEVLQGYLQDAINYELPQGESMNAFHARMSFAWESLWQFLRSHHCDECLLITHAGPMRWLFSEVTGAPLHKTYHLKVEYSSLMSFELLPAGEEDQRHDDPPFIRLIGLCGSV